MDKEACICVITARKAQDKDHKGMSIRGAQIQELPNLVSTCVIIKGQAQDKDHKGMSIHGAQVQDLGELESICVITRSMAQDKDHKGMGIRGAQIQDLDSLAESISGYESTVPDKTEKSEPLIDETVKANFSSETLNSQARETFSPESNWVESWSQEEIKELQRNDSIISKVLEFKNARTDPPDKVMLFSQTEELKRLCAQWSQLEVHNEILYRRWFPHDKTETESIQIVVPVALRHEILHMLHNHKSSGHLGIAKTLKKVRQRFYWPGYKADIARWIKGCIVCESISGKMNPQRAPLQPRPVFRRMDRIACDLMGPVPTSEQGNSYILVVADYFTKYTEAYALPDMTAQTVADKLSTEWFCRFGTAVCLHSDQGRQFESALFKELCKTWDIHKTRTARYRPQSDGVVERQNRTIRKILRSLIEDIKTWDEHLPFALMAYNASIHESTICSPNLLLFGNKNRLPVDLMYAGCSPENETPGCPCEYLEWLREAARNAFNRARTNLKKSAERQSRVYDKNTFLREFKIGDWVWVFYPPAFKEKFGRDWKGPFLVVKKLSDVNYVVQQKPDSRKVTLHVDHMKLYSHENTPEKWVKADSIAAKQEQSTQTVDNLMY